ncbi:MAG TPA: 23S rRNA (guanosine(2251)-2'-O)-methyltransferase RlmB [Alphaproteobacteria bacterium]
MKGKNRPSRSCAPSEGHSRTGGSARFRNTQPELDRRPHGGRGAPPRPKSRGVWLYGIHPVLAAIANARRTTYRIVMTPEADSTLGPRVAALAESMPTNLPAPEVMPRDALERLLPRGAVHQGIAAEVDTLDEPDIEDVIRATESQSNARIVVLDQVTDPHNVGAVIRSAAAFGSAAVVVPERNSPGVTGTLAKAASGALERVPLVRVVNLARALDQLKKAGYWCVGLDADASTAIHDADLSGKIALVLGAEGEGLRRLTREHCDLMVRIPISRGMESLNVSNAAAVALYELVRPR